MLHIAICRWQASAVRCAQAAVLREPHAHADQNMLCCGLQLLKCPHCTAHAFAPIGTITDSHAEVDDSLPSITPSHVTRKQLLTCCYLATRHCREQPQNLPGFASNVHVKI